MLHSDYWIINIPKIEKGFELVIQKNETNNTEKSKKTKSKKNEKTKPKKLKSSKKNGSLHNNTDSFVDVTKMKEIYNKIDSKYTTDNSVAIMNAYYPMKLKKYFFNERICEDTDNQYKTVAFYKCYEMLNMFKKEFGFVSSSGHIKKINMFDNASFPGSFIMATQSFCRQNGIEFDFMASSLVSGEHLEVYDFLWKEHRHKYVVDDHNKGDIFSDADNADLVKKVHKRKFEVDLYTSDLGWYFKKGAEYVNEERKYCVGFKKQMLTAFRILKNGGSIISKILGFQTKETISWILLVSSFFKKSFIYKPITSKKTSLEAYVVFTNFNKKKFDHPNNAKMLINLIQNNNIKINLENFKTNPLFVTFRKDVMLYLEKMNDVGRNKLLFFDSFSKDEEQQKQEFKTFVQKDTRYVDMFHSFESLIRRNVEKDFE